MSKIEGKLSSNKGIYKDVLRWCRGLLTISDIIQHVRGEKLPHLFNEQKTEYSIFL